MRIRKTLMAALAGLVLSFAATAQEIHSRHCLYSCPFGGSSDNDLIVRESYILRSNDLTKFAKWVAYRVTRDTIGADKSPAFRADPALNPDETLEPEDYRGAESWIQTDAGFQAPAQSFTGTPHWQETGMLSNIVPRKSALNRGPWRRLEAAVRRLARASSVDAVYVLTGPVYEHAMVGLPGADETHVVPSAFWKIVAVRAGAGARVAAFVFDQRTPAGADYCRHRVGLRAVEQRSGLIFFNHAAGQLTPMAAAIGC